MKIKRFGTLVEHAGSGLKLPEETARKIDELAKGLPKDFTYRRMAKASAGMELNPGERTDISTITTDAVDRDGEVVLPGGGDWSSYNKVVTFAHRYDELPIGASWWMKPKGNGIAAKTHYPPKPADWGDAPWLPSAVLHLMQQPVPTCTGKSIGFLPLNVRSATPDERQRRPELDGVPMIDKWAGIEYAVAPVPCNPTAEMEAVSKGVASGLLDSRVGDLIAKTLSQYGANKGSAADQLRMEGVHIAALQIVASYGPVTVGGLGMYMGCALPTAATSVKYLLKRDCIRETADGFVITDHGRDALASATAPTGDEMVIASTRAVVHLTDTMTAAQIGKALKARKGSKDLSGPPSLLRTYTQYIQSGDTYEPVGDVQLEPTLDKFAYRIIPTWSGIGFTKMQPQTDELYYFENSAMNTTLDEIDKFWSLKPDYDKLGLMHNRGIMLYGPPGTGKTSIMHQVAKMIVGRGDVVFYAKKIGLLTEGLKSFREVEPDRKVVVVLEDADEYAGYEEREFLQLLDGEQSINGVLYLASTNYIDRFPPRLLRPGRFDKKVFVGAPPFAGRLAYLSKKLDKMEKPEEIERLAKETDGLSFGDLRELVTAVYALKEPVEAVLKRLHGRATSNRKSRKPMDTTTVDSTGKAMGESDNSAGGAVVLDDAQPAAKMPVCPKCKTNENVEPLKGSDGDYFQCNICGERMKDDDGDGEMMDAVDPAQVDNKTTVVPGDDPDNDGDTDPIVVCPLCREPAKMTGDVEVSGLGSCDTYECPKCGNKFLQPEGAHRAPELNGNTDGTPQQNADGGYAAPPQPDGKSTQEKKTVKPFVRPETVLAAVDRKRKQNAAALAAQLVPIVHEALDKRQGRV